MRKKHTHTHTRARLLAASSISPGGTFQKTRLGQQNLHPQALRFTRTRASSILSYKCCHGCCTHLREKPETAGVASERGVLQVLSEGLREVRRELRVDQSTSTATTPRDGKGHASTRVLGRGSGG